MISDFLQLASPIGFTDHAIVMVTSQQQLQDSPASPHDLGGIRPDDHVINDRGMASGLQFRSVLDFHQADPTGTFLTKPGVIAQTRHIDMVLATNVQNRLSILSLNSTPVNLQTRHPYRSILPEFRIHPSRWVSSRSQF
jgi:hypothetical protein